MDVFVAVVNRVGYEGRPEKGDPGMSFGESFVADPAGQLLAEGSNDKEEILVAEIEPKKSEEQRRNWPFFRDRRIDAFWGVDSEVAGRRVRKDGKEFNAEVAESAEYAEKKTARVKRRDWVRFDRKSPPSSSFGRRRSLKKAKTEEKTPEQMGFRMPAEWERHEGTWLGWPHE